MSPTEQVAARRLYLQNSQYVDETTSAAFDQHEFKAISSCLNVVYGVRYEKTENAGKGLKINGTSNSLAEIRTNWIERGQVIMKDDDGYYPSINANFTLTEDPIIRAGYTKTFGRPNFANIIPLTRINDTTSVENDGTGNINADTVLVRSIGLKPWRADNYDVTFEHYLPKAGLVSVRGFLKDLTGFFVTGDRPLTEADMAEFNLENIDATTPARGMTLQSSFHSSVPALLGGDELTYRISTLPLIPQSVGNFEFFASYTNQRTTGPGQINFTVFAPEFANARINYSKTNSRPRWGQATPPVDWSGCWGPRPTNVSAASLTTSRKYVSERTSVDVSALGTLWRINRSWRKS